MSNKTTVELIEERIRSGLGAASVEVEDHSERHRGHPGAASGAGHYRVTVVAAAFAGKSRLESQRLVYDAVGDLMKTRIHALEMVLKNEE